MPQQLNVGEVDLIAYSKSVLSNSTDSDDGVATMIAQIILLLLAKATGNLLVLLNLYLLFIYIFSFILSLLSPSLSIVLLLLNLRSVRRFVFLMRFILVS